MISYSQRKSGITLDSQSSANLGCRSVEDCFPREHTLSLVPDRKGMGSIQKCTVFGPTSAFQNLEALNFVYLSERYCAKRPPVAAAIVKTKGGNFVKQFEAFR